MKLDNILSTVVGIILLVIAVSVLGGTGGPGGFGEEEPEIPRTARNPATKTAPRDFILEAYRETTTIGSKGIPMQGIAVDYTLDGVPHKYTNTYQPVPWTKKFTSYGGAVNLVVRPLGGFAKSEGKIRCSITIKGAPSPIVQDIVLNPDGTAHCSLLGSVS